MQAIAQLPSGSQKLTVSKLLPEKHIACQLTKEGEKKILTDCGALSFLVLMSPDRETQWKRCDYKHLGGREHGKEEKPKEHPNLSHVAGNLDKKKRRRRRRNEIIKITNEPVNALLMGAPIWFRIGSPSRLGWKNVWCKPSSGETPAARFNPWWGGRAWWVRVETERTSKSPGHRVTCIWRFCHRCLSYFTGDLLEESARKNGGKKSWADKSVIRTEEGQDGSGSCSLGSARSVLHSPLPSGAWLWSRRQQGRARVVFFSTRGSSVLSYGRPYGRTWGAAAGAGEGGVCALSALWAEDAAPLSFLGTQPTLSTQPILNSCLGLGVGVRVCVGMRVARSRGPWNQGQENRVSVEMDTWQGLYGKPPSYCHVVRLYAFLQPGLWRVVQSATGRISGGCDLEEKRTLSRMPVCCISGVRATRGGKTQVYSLLCGLSSPLYKLFLLRGFPFPLHSLID